MEEPTREMEKETGAETDLPETEPAAEQEEAKKAAEAKEAEAAEETAEDGKERKFFKKKKDKKDEKIEELTDRLTRQMAKLPDKDSVLVGRYLSGNGKHPPPCKLGVPLFLHSFGGVP